MSELSAILNAIPFDMTFVDKDDKVRYFTQGRENRYCRKTGVSDLVEKRGRRGVQDLYHAKNLIVQTFLYRMYNKTKLIAINNVDGNADPMPSGAMATRKMIPPRIPNKKSFLFFNRNIPTRI